MFELWAMFDRHVEFTKRLIENEVTVRQQGQGIGFVGQSKEKRTFRHVARSARKDKCENGSNVLEYDRWRHSLAHELSAWEVSVGKRHRR
jgi:hypothetical protein